MHIHYLPHGIRLGEYEPGNGTNYKVVAIPWNHDISLSSLGRVSQGWLVINCNTQRASLFQKEGILVDVYIQEKLGGFPGDYPHFGDLVRHILEREEVTDDDQRGSKGTN